jgi:hypothetical protein
LGWYSIVSSRIVFLSVIEDGAKEATRAFFLRIVEDFSGCPGLDDAPAIHEDDAVCDLTGKAHLVCDNDHGDTGASKFAHDVEHFADHFRIKRRCRLVEQQDPWLHRKRTGNSHALLLAARKLLGILLRLLGNADAGKQFARFAFRLFGAVSFEPAWGRS